MQASIAQRNLTAYLIGGCSARCCTNTYAQDTLTPSLSGLAANSGLIYLGDN